MNLSFGARLRLQRERQQVALAAIAAETKIKRSLLEALERDDFSQWPEGIFRRAFLRSYAQAIGLDPVVVIREFVTCHPDPADVAASSAASSPDTTSESASPPPATRLRRLVTAAIAAVPSLQHPQRRAAALATPPAPTREHSAESEPVHTVPAVSVAAFEDLVQREAAVGPVLSDRPAQAPQPGVEAAPNDSVEDDPVRAEPSLAAIADLCTRLGRVVDRREMAPLLEDAAALLDAVGLVVWSCDPRASALRPWLTHGYSKPALAHLPVVRSDADNAIAAAFRTAETCLVNGGDGVTGALVVPLMAPRGCVGVLALELDHGDEQREWVRALATILGAQLATLLGSAPLAEAVSA